MLDDRPNLREGLLATAAFAAIAIATLGALDFIVTGGFDFGAQRTASTYGSPLIGAAAPVLAAEPPASAVTAVTWTDPAAVAEPDDVVPAPSEDEFSQEIAELYLEDAPQGEDEAQDAAANEGALSGGNDISFDPLDLRPEPNAPDSE